MYLYVKLKFEYAIHSFLEESMLSAWSLLIDFDVLVVSIYIQCALVPELYFYLKRIPQLFIQWRKPLVKFLNYQNNAYSI